nr:MAG TPA_asm: hypothetical protein [Bacteriophage sp.]
MNVRFAPSSWVRPNNYDQIVVQRAVFNQGILTDTVGSNWLPATDVTQLQEFDVYTIQYMYQLAAGISTYIGNG